MGNEIVLSYPTTALPVQTVPPMHASYSLLIKEATDLNTSIRNLTEEYVSKMFYCIVKDVTEWSKMHFLS